jgi:hypothetical protein
MQWMSDNWVLVLLIGGVVVVAAAIAAVCFAATAAATVTGTVAGDAAVTVTDMDQIIMDMITTEMTARIRTRRRRGLLSHLMKIREKSATSAGEEPDAWVLWKL